MHRRNAFTFPSESCPTDCSKSADRTIPTPVGTTILSRTTFCGGFGPSPRVWGELSKAHCFNWPDGEPTILFVRDKSGEYSARIQNVEHGCSLWGTRSTHGAKKSLKGRFPDEESEAGARCTNQIPWTA